MPSTFVERAKWCDAEINDMLAWFDAQGTKMSDREREIYSRGFRQGWSKLDALLRLHKEIQL